MWKSMVVVDDFYDDADEVRALALGLAYCDGGEGYFAGRESKVVLINDRIVGAISGFAGGPLVPVPGSAQGNFRIAFADDRPNQDIHLDSGRDWAVLVYLSLPEHCRGGTSLFRHKALGLDEVPRNPAAIARHGFASYEEMRDVITERDGHDRDKWDVVMTAPMRFNRLVMFRPWLWHSFDVVFGDRPENARLTQIFFFNHAGTRPAVRQSAGAPQPAHAGPA